MSPLRSPRPVALGRLRRLRVDQLAEEGQAPLLDHSEHLLQLRVGVRHPRLRRQGAADRPQDRRQPAAPRQPRPHLREGRRHAEPARRSGPHPLPAAARRRARIGRVDAGVVGRGAGRHRRADPQGDRREPAARDHVSRRPSRRGRLREPRAAGVGPRRPQQPHQRLLLVGATRDTFSGAATIGRRPTTRTPKRSCCCRRISRPATTSTRTRSASSKASRTAPR